MDGGRNIADMGEDMQLQLFGVTSRQASLFGPKTDTSNPRRHDYFNPPPTLSLFIPHPQDFYENLYLTERIVDGHVKLALVRFLRSPPILRRFLQTVRATSFWRPSLFCS